MSAPLHRPVHGDPWGLGYADGTLVEVPNEAHRDVPPHATPSERPDIDPPSIDVRPPPAIPAAAAPATNVPRLADLRLDHGHRRAAPPPAATRLAPMPVMVAAAAAAVAAAGALFWWLTAAAATVAPAGGTFVLSSQPPGAQVAVDGRPAGITPLALALAPGAHDVVATAGGRSERFSVSVAAGESSSRHVMLEKTRPVASPAAAPTALPAAALATAPGAVPGSAASGAADSVAWVSFSLPFEARIFEGERLLVSRAGPSTRVRVRPGAHTFTLVNDALGVRLDESVVARAGETTRHAVAERTAPLSVNALPWAEVLISGRSYGETPLANIALPIGTYQVTLRHPALGERVETVTVRLGSPNRLAVDLRR